MNIGNPVPTTSIIDDKGWMSNNFRTWTQQISRAVSDLLDQTTLSGVGSPEGVVTANPKRQYMDTTGATGSILYIKQTGTNNTGWVLV